MALMQCTPSPLLGVQPDHRLQPLAFSGGCFTSDAGLLKELFARSTLGFRAFPTLRKQKSLRLRRSFRLRTSVSCSSTITNIASGTITTRTQNEAVKLEDILAEHDACGVGFIASLKNDASHRVIQDALVALGCMEHRGGCSADNDSGDGAGLMAGIPWKLFGKWFEEQGITSIDESNTGVGMVFLPQEEALASAAKEVIEQIFTQEGVNVLGWRPVPINSAVVGHYARITQPNIQQVFVKVVKEGAHDDVERELYISRKLIEKAAKSEAWGKELYFCSLSNSTIVYKGMLRSEVLGTFYLDLQNELFTSPFAIYHRRYSTNTNPRWPLAQPMRFLGHNGEINTLQGNLNWMQSRETSMKSLVWRGREDEIRPFGNPNASDSANLDSVAEAAIEEGVHTPCIKGCTLLLLIYADDVVMQWFMDRLLGRSLTKELQLNINRTKMMLIKTHQPSINPKLHIMGIPSNL